MPTTTAPPRLAVGRTVGVTERFSYRHPVTGDWHDIAVGSRLVLLRRDGRVWRVRVRELVFRVPQAWLERVTAVRTEGK